MKISKIKPNLSVYSLRAEKGEVMGLRCAWARIILDNDNYNMSAVTDCGNYSYTWSVTESEPFLDLMCRIDKSYLLGKISNMSKFNLEKSKEKTIENMKKWHFDDEELLNAIDTIKEIECASEEHFFTIGYNIKFLDFEEIEIVKEYPAGAIAFADLFIDYLQPELKKKSANK